MDPNVALGPVDPQIGLLPAASIVKAVERNPVEEIDDHTIILADISFKALDKVTDFATSLLSGGFPEDKAREIVDTSENRTEEFIVENKDGICFFVEVSASGVTSASGECFGRMASFIDITKCKMLETDLQKSFRMHSGKKKVLRGVLPICASCKKIRADRGCWNRLEGYIKEHSEAVFSHGICPDCTKELYADFAMYSANRQ